MVVGGIFFALTCCVAITGYMIAGWAFLDAIYMVVITVFGVGYGETKPLDSAPLKVFTMGVIIAGCSSGIYVVGGFVQMLAEGEINRALGTRRMSKGIELLKNHALICGFGRVGQMLAADLAKAGHPLVVIDSCQSRIDEAIAVGHLAVLGSASDESSLLAAGIERARVLATVLPDDTANVFITLTARELNPALEIIARAESPSTEKKLRRSGANRVVLPALIGATKIAHLITAPTAEDMLSAESGLVQLNEDLKQLGLELSEVELTANSPLIGQTIGDVEGAGKSGFVVVGIKGSDGSNQTKPPADRRLSLGDKIVVVGHADAAIQLSRKAKRNTVSFRGATT